MFFKRKPNIEANTAESGAASKGNAQERKTLTEEQAIRILTDAKHSVQPEVRQMGISRSLHYIQVTPEYFKTVTGAEARQFGEESVYIIDPLNKEITLNIEALEAIAGIKIRDINGASAIPSAETKKRFTATQAQKLLAALENGQIDFERFQDIVGDAPRTAADYAAWTAWNGHRAVIYFNEAELQKDAGAEVAKPGISDIGVVEQTRAEDAGAKGTSYVKQHQKNPRAAALANIKRNQEAGIVGNGASSTPGFTDGFGR